MKSFFQKIIICSLILIDGRLLFAEPLKVFSAEVVQLKQDDEGVKVITKTVNNGSQKLTAVYLKNTHQNFKTILNSLENAKAQQKPVRFSTEKKQFTEVIEVGGDK